jgi:hypothetical protein
MKKTKFAILLLSISLFAFTNCNKEEEVEEVEKPPMGILDGTVTSATTGKAISGAQINLYLENGDPAGISLETDTSGFYSAELSPGNYSARVYSQGFESIPPEGVKPVGFNIADDQTTTKNYQMGNSNVINGGWITGSLIAGESPVLGAMIVAIQGADAYSGISIAEGVYTIYNVPAGDYNLTAWKQGFNSSQINTTVVENTQSAGQDIVMTEDANGSLNGTITFLAVNNGIVDVTLIEPVSGRAIPGLSVMIDEDRNYSMTGIPNGDYIARASFANDTYVLDPDWIIKFGEPEVSINNNAVEEDFSVTGAVTLTSPNNIYPDATPIEVTETVPAFTWVAYPSASDYAIEVTDANGNLIWGGIDTSGDIPVKNVIVDGTTITFNYDGTATETALEAGQIYRWRIYASKDDNNEPAGWKLISMSEDQMGLISIVEAE